MRRYPMLFGPKGRAYMKLQTIWDIRKPGRTVDIGYRSKIQVEGKWIDFSVSGTGKASGTISVDSQGGLPLRHEGMLQRSVCYAGEEQLCQAQTFQFLLESIP